MSKEARELGREASSLLDVSGGATAFLQAFLQRALSAASPALSRADRAHDLVHELKIAALKVTLARTKDETQIGIRFEITTDYFPMDEITLAEIKTCLQEYGNCVLMHPLDCASGPCAQEPISTGQYL